MLHLQVIHLFYLIILLSPGVISGAIVTWKTRSPWALFITIGFSLLGSFIVAASTVIFGKLVAPFLVTWLGDWTSLIDFTQTPSRHDWLGSLPYYLLSYYRYSLVAPIGTVAGATLAGMLAIVRYQLLREGGKFQSSYAWTAGFGSTVVGGVLGLCSILFLSWLGWQGILLISIMFSSGGQYPALFAQVTAGILIILNGLICGFISAVCGIKLAKFLM
jgi:hypothetical protein